MFSAPHRRTTLVVTIRHKAPHANAQVQPRISIQCSCDEGECDRVDCNLSKTVQRLQQHTSEETIASMHKRGLTATSRLGTASISSPGEACFGEELIPDRACAHIDCVGGGTIGHGILNNSKCEWTEKAKRATQPLSRFNIRGAPAIHTLFGQRLCPSAALRRTLFMAVWRQTYVLRMGSLLQHTRLSEVQAS
jgi:hypothetical protein